MDGVEKCSEVLMSEQWMCFRVRAFGFLVSVPKVLVLPLTVFSCVTLKQTIYGKRRSCFMQLTFICKYMSPEPVNSFLYRLLIIQVST